MSNYTTHVQIGPEGIRAALVCDDKFESGCEDWVEGITQCLYQGPDCTTALHVAQAYVADQGEDHEIVDVALDTQAATCQGRKMAALLDQNGREFHCRIGPAKFMLWGSRHCRCDACGRVGPRNKATAIGAAWICGTCQVKLNRLSHGDPTWVICDACGKPVMLARAIQQDSNLLCQACMR